MNLLNNGGNGVKIVVVGAGYVGISNALLLSQKNEVVLIDIIKDKIDLINSKKSPIVEKDIDEFLCTKDLNLKGSLDLRDSIEGADYALICTQTNYNPETKCFDTSSVEKTIKQIIEYNKNCQIVIKSTVGVGFTKKMADEVNTSLLFCPEFLREGKALFDSLHPSRIIVGYSNENIANKAECFASLLKECSLEQDVKVILTGSSEAESIKLFSNTYLALRIAFFNELDSFSESKGLNTKTIIDGVSSDDRIGNYYNNPSFGYGGYCLPKDTKELKSNFSDIPERLISAIIESNDARKEFVADRILKKNTANGTIGVFRLIMKTNADNYRNSSILDIIRLLKENGANVIVYEPLIKEAKFMGCDVVNDLNEFKKASKLVIANRKDKLLDDVQNKLYTRDIFNGD